MGTRVDHSINDMLSIRFDLHGRGPSLNEGAVVAVSLESHQVLAREPLEHTASVRLATELSREQAVSLRDHLTAAINDWDDSRKYP